MTEPRSHRSDDLAEDAAFWCFIATLAWAPFPLGSNRGWSWSLLVLLIALSWSLWGFASLRRAGRNTIFFREFKVAIILGAAALLWPLIQILPFVPTSWAHPMWALASDTLGRKLPATISINPWRTLQEFMKLASYAMVIWLAFSMSLQSARASRMLNAIIVIGTGYALYSIVLKLLDFSQYQLFYATTPVLDHYFSGPFVLHNSYATYAGLVSLAAFLQLVRSGSKMIVTQRGTREWLLSALQFGFGYGLRFLLPLLLSFSTLIASASRAGTFATLCAIAAMAIAALLTGMRTSSRQFAAAAISVGAIIVGLIALSGDTLVLRLNLLVEAGNADEVRLALWSAAQRMISDSWALGLGLGTFQDAYPLYATHALPFFMDKAHNDYLEFAAGLGLPAAFAWWMAWAILAWRCLRGVHNRKRDRHFALLAFGASVLVAVHSAFDFSLQMPAVTVLYATMLGLGLAQSLPTASRK